MEFTPAWLLDYIVDKQRLSQGGFIVGPDKLTFFVGADSIDKGYTGAATLRRDGFASITSRSSGGELLTRTLRFSGGFLFVNANVLQITI